LEGQGADDIAGKRGLADAAFYIPHCQNHCTPQTILKQDHITVICISIRYHSQE